MKKLYLAGPMRGKPQYNWPAFIEAAKTLRERGFEVVSPVEMDEANGVTPEKIKSGEDMSKLYADCMRRDVVAVAGCDGVAVLPGWEHSQGASFEVALARELKMPVVKWDTLEPVATIEGRKFDGGKLRFDLVPADAFEAVVQILTDGSEKYGDRNWETGMAWGRCYAAALRHLSAFWRGVNIDHESRRPHIAHAICCLLFLLSYQLRGMNNFDDRPKKPEPKNA